MPCQTGQHQRTACVADCMNANILLSVLQSSRNASICTHECIHMCMCAHMHVYVYMPILRCARVFPHVYVCMCMSTCAPACACMLKVYVCSCMSTCVYVCVRVCMYSHSSKGYISNEEFEGLNFGWKKIC